MSRRFQADNDLRPDIISALLRQVPEIDFKTARAAGLDGLDDVTVLRQAAAADRLLVTHDRTTIQKAVDKLYAEGVDIPGVLVVIPQAAPVSPVVETLILIWGASEAWEWRNRVVKIPF